MRENEASREREKETAEEEEEAESASTTEEETVWNRKKESLIHELARKLIESADLDTKITAARAIRKVIRNSPSPSSSVKTRSRFAAAGVIQPLVSMLLSVNLDAREAALLALLNLAVRNERNKVKIVESGAVPPLVELLKSQNRSIRELAAAAILTLSAAAPNKPRIAASGAAPLLVQILCSGSVQSRVDAVTALHYLSTCTEIASPILDSTAVPPLMNLLKDCKKYSKFAEKTTALLEILCRIEDGQIAITNCHGGILTLVETVEEGSSISSEHAVGSLLALCQSCRTKYRQLILNEGAIPGLLRLTAYGTPLAQDRARMLLDLLRESSKDKETPSSNLEKMAYDIAKCVDGEDKAAETAKKLLHDMVHRSMELSMNNMERIASSANLSS
uniref:U-box domain-containing protein n=1 Tax=Kalanchoe fedtschenkoi TaxID=63787 RepID=A0A7N0VBN1_KALFE